MALKMHPPLESTATFIRAHLLSVGVDYAYGVWKKWCQHLADLGMKGPKHYSFKVYWRTLVRAGLIQRVPSPPSSEPAKGKYSGLKPRPRVYYELVRANVDNEKTWANPQVAVFGEALRLGARRYRRRVLNLPAKKRGRPPKEHRKYGL